MSDETIKPEENPKSKEIDELNDEDLKAVTGGATTEENTALQNQTLRNSKAARKGTGALDTFIAS
jgi:bacteriocin-like protein